MMPHYVVYGQKPPTYTPYITPYIPGESLLATLDQALKDIESILRLLKENLPQARSSMKKMADKRKSEQTIWGG